MLPIPMVRELQLMTSRLVLLVAVGLTTTYSLTQPSTTSFLWLQRRMGWLWLRVAVLPLLATTPTLTVEQRPNVTQSTVLRLQQQIEFFFTIRRSHGSIPLLVGKSVITRLTLRQALPVLVLSLAVSQVGTRYLMAH